MTMPKAKETNLKKCYEQIYKNHLSTFNLQFSTFNLQPSIFNFPQAYPIAPASIIIIIGETPNAHIAKAEAMGIQQLDHVTFAVFAIFNVGTAMSATTAGRMPRNMAATTGLSSNWRKNIAMARMMRKEE